MGLQNSRYLGFLQNLKNIIFHKADEWKQVEDLLDKLATTPHILSLDVIMALQKNKF